MNQQLKNAISSGSRTTAVTGPPVTTLAHVAPAHIGTLPSFSGHGFPWFHAANQHEALDYLEGIQLATARKLPHQVAQYQQEILRLTTKDMVDRVHWVTTNELGYSGERYYHPHDEKRLDDVPFTPTDGHSIWFCYRIEKFHQLIPPAALRAQAVVERAGIHPQAYWVIIKFNVSPISTFVSLKVQFGRWFQTIHDWPHNYCEVAYVKKG